MLTLQHVEVVRFGDAVLRAEPPPRSLSNPLWVFALPRSCLFDSARLALIEMAISDSRRAVEIIYRLGFAAFRASLLSGKLGDDAPSTLAVFLCEHTCMGGITVVPRASGSTRSLWISETSFS